MRSGEQVIFVGDNDAVEILVLAVIIDAAENFQTVEAGTLQIIKNQNDFLPHAGGKIIGLRADGDQVNGVDGHHRRGDTAGDGIHSPQSIPDGGEKAAVLLQFFALLLQFAQKGRADIKPLSVDRFVQRINAVDAEEGNADDHMAVAERLREGGFNQIGFSAAPFTGQKDGAHGILFAAVIDQFVECTHGKISLEKLSSFLYVFILT